MRYGLLLAALWPLGCLAQKAVPDSPLPNNVAYMPPAFYLHLDDVNAGLVRVRLPLEQVQGIVRDAAHRLIEQRKKEDSGFRDSKPRLAAFRFIDVVPGSERIGVHIHVSVPEALWIPLLGKHIGVECKLNPRFTLKASKLSDLKFQDAGTSTECDGSWEVHAFRTDAENALRKLIVQHINGGVFLDRKTLDDWLESDPEWARFIQEAIVSMKYCSGPNEEPSLCFDLTWPISAMLSERPAKLVASAPMAAGPADKSHSASEAQSYFDLAWKHNAKPSKSVSYGKYPAELLENGTFNDFDMALFGGLVCLAGRDEGCELVRKSQGRDGRFWRSPDRVDNHQLKDGSPFSGDAFNGVVAYFATTKDNDAGTRFTNYLKYVSANKQKFHKTTVYKSCTQDDALQCVLGGAEWHWLNLLAEKYGVATLVPTDVRDARGTFGFSEDMMVWQAALVPAGYRLHLTAIQVALSRAIRGDSETLRRAAATLAARQPANPFHLYLHLGADMLAQANLPTYCDRSRTQKEYTDWAWQRPTTEKAWLRSMRWDCFFMHQMLTQ